MAQQMIYASSGGGIRIGASFAAVAEGERLNRFSAKQFDYYVGTSAGALDALLTANGWSGERKVDLFLETNWVRFFQPLGCPFALRKMLALSYPMSLKPLARFIETLDAASPERLLINTVDAETNQQVIYCEQLPEWLPGETELNTARLRWEVGAFSRYGLGMCLARSMVLPGLVADDPRYVDGGVAENPVLSVLPKTAQILLIHLGYAGLVRYTDQHTVPNTLLEKALYSYEFKAYAYAEHLIAELPGVQAIFPKVFDVDSAAFNLSRAQRYALVARAQKNTTAQWLVLDALN